jgi:hypothetical protein
MYLESRPGKISDLESGFLLVQKQYFFDVGTRMDVLRFWRHLMDQGACISNVIEDRDRPQGQRLALFGIFAFMNDGFLREVKTTLKPFLPQRVVERFVQGTRDVLTQEEIVKAHSLHGINIVSLHYGFDSFYGPEDAARIYELVVKTEKAFLKILRISGKLFNHIPFPLLSAGEICSV